MSLTTLSYMCEPSASYIINGDDHKHFNLDLSKLQLLRQRIINPYVSFLGRRKLIQLGSRLRQHGFWAPRQKSLSFVAFIVFTENRASAEFWKLTKFLDEYFVSVSRSARTETDFAGSLVSFPGPCCFMIHRNEATRSGNHKKLISHSISSSLFAFFIYRFSQSCDDFLHLHYTWFKIRPEVENSRNRSCKRADLWLHF